jgi:hypothetical protein
MEGVCEQIGDMAVKLNDELAEREDNFMEKNFQYPIIGIQFFFTVKKERV